jgi:hypothetical protein
LGLKITLKEISEFYKKFISALPPPEKLKNVKKKMSKRFFLYCSTRESTPTAEPADPAKPKALKNPDESLKLLIYTCGG